MSNKMADKSKPVIADFSVSHPQTRVIAVVAVSLFIVIAGIATYMYYRHESSQQINRTKLAAVMDQDSCAKGLQAMSAEKVNPRHIADSVALLSYRAYCMEQVGDNQGAINTLQQLESYYQKENDTKDATIANDRIAGIKQYLALPVNSTRPPGEPPSLVKSIQQAEARE
jgi:hypothetical protein